MKRNRYALGILLLLALTLFGCWRFVNGSSQTMQSEIRGAYALAAAGDYPAARRHFADAAAHAERQSRMLGLLVRRTQLERISETMAVLAEYAGPDNLADLAVETERVCAQIEQMKRSFLGVF